MLRRCAAVLMVVFLSAAPGSAGTQRDAGYWIQVFALSGPVCPVVILGEECPDALLSGVLLVLERLDRRGGVFEEVTRFETNERGYAHLLVERRGTYRVDVAPRPSTGLLAQRPPFLESPVTFRVPARHRTENGFQLTPVVVNFDSGIR